MPFQIPIKNIKNLSDAIIVDSVPESKIWKDWKFVRCANAIYNIAELQVSSNQREHLNTFNNSYKSILPVQFENCVLSEAAVCWRMRERIRYDFR
jgi:hypothetical protein